MTMAKEQYRKQRGRATLERPIYKAGLLLEDDDLTSAVNYTRNMVRLLFRSLFGCGVICGLDVTAELVCNNSQIRVSIAKGVALDCAGNPIEVPNGFTITYDPDCDPLPDELWVVACYCEECCRPRDTSCAPDDSGTPVKTRIMDGYEVRLYDKRPKCVCSCEPPDTTKKSLSECCDDEDTTKEPESAAAAAQVFAAAPMNEMTGEIEVPPRLPDECQCYEDHVAGKCDCDCGCACVLIGHVSVTKDSEKQPTIAWDGKWVRRIRPVLLGYYKCLKASQIVETIKESTPKEMASRRRTTARSR